MGMKLTLLVLLVVGCGTDVRPEIQPDASLPDAVRPDTAMADAAVDAAADAPVDARPDAYACPVPKPCSFIGCDGTQSVPLYCPPDGTDPRQPIPGTCFCAAPKGVDQWCWP